MQSSGQLPDEIIYAPLDVSGARYVLPRRRLGRFHLIGLFLTMFGLFFAGIPALGFGILVSQMVRQARFEVVELIMLLVTIPFMAIGVALCAVGRFVSAGRTEIEINDTHLQVRERAGIFRWTRKIAIDTVRTLKVMRSRDQQPTAAFAALGADTGQQRPRLIAVGYPESLLEPLARELTEHLAIDGEKPEVVVEDMDADDEDDEWSDEIAADGAAASAEPLPRPDWSKTKVERFDGGGVTLNVPAAGLIRGSKGLFLFALFWLALSIGVCSVFLVSAIGGGAWKTLLIVVPIAGIFVSIGVGLLIAAINMGTRRVAFAVFDGRLMLMTKGIFGTKNMEWAGEDIESVRVGPSGMTVNDQPVLNLQIHVRGGKTGLLAGHPDEELEWLADEIRRALNATC